MAGVFCIFIRYLTDYYNAYFIAYLVHFTRYVRNNSNGLSTFGFLFNQWDHYAIKRLVAAFRRVISAQCVAICIIDNGSEGRFKSFRVTYGNRKCSISTVIRSFDNDRFRELRFNCLCSQGVPHPYDSRENRRACNNNGFGATRDRLLLAITRWVPTACSCCGGNSRCPTTWRYIRRLNSDRKERNSDYGIRRFVSCYFKVRDRPCKMLRPNVNSRGPPDKSHYSRSNRPNKYRVRALTRFIPTRRRSNGRDNFRGGYRSSFSDR